jgi:hypothetical protein
MHPTAQKLAYKDRLVAVLVEAGKKRSLRQNIVNTPHGPELGWAQYEREVMFEETNRLRAEQGHVLGDFARIERFDRLAAGHVDWAEKFSLYCAEYAMQVQP